jgi:hypothetical protein
MLNELALVRVAITVHLGGVVCLARMAIERKQAQGHGQQRRDSLHVWFADHREPACLLLVVGALSTPGPAAGGESLRSPDCSHSQNGLTSALTSQVKAQSKKPPLGWLSQLSD